MDLAMIIVLSISLLVSVITLIISLRKRVNVKEIEAQAEIRHLLGDLEKRLPDLVHSSVQEELLKLQQNWANQNEKEQNRLGQFETKMNEQLQNQFKTINELLFKRLENMNQAMNTSLEGGFKSTMEAYQNLSLKLEIIEQAKANIQALSGEVVSLKQVLDNNQNRGRFGEFTLERILYSIFGDTKGLYATQYPLKNYGEHERPDAVVFLPEPNKMICIDSKFPFANYRQIIEGETKEKREESAKGFLQMLRKHITDIKKKYIVPGLTADNALLFIPSDAIFAYVHGQMPEVVEYARESRVILTSPSTLQPILATINLVRINYERNKNIDNIMKQLQTLAKDFERFGGEWQKLSEGIEKLDRARSNVDRHVQKINQKFDSINHVVEIDDKTEEEVG